MSKWIQPTIDFFSALLTPTIGVITTYIAYQQYRQGEGAKKRELLDRRLTVFKACMSFLGKTVQQRPDSNTINQFLRETADAFYLFKDEIEKYLDEVYKKAIEFEYSEKMLDDPHIGVGPKRNELAKKSSDLQAWFSQQFNIARSKFKPYLDVHE